MNKQTNAQKRQAAGVRHVAEQDRDEQMIKVGHENLTKALASLRDATMYLDVANSKLGTVQNAQVRQIQRTSSRAADKISDAYKVVNHMAAALKHV